MNDSANLAADALDAYIYGYPIVLMETTRRNMMAGGLQTNRFMMESGFPAPGMNIVVRPNVDTLYSSAWLDLSAEPVVMHVPDTNGKYYVMELMDDWTNVFASVGSRTTGTGERDFLVAGPGWNGYNPYRLPVIHAPTNTVWALGRIQTDGPKDYPLVNALQQAFLLSPLSYWARYGFSGIANVASGKPPRIAVTPADQVEMMDAAVFFRILAAAMQANPPAIRDPAMEQKLAELGLTAGASFDYYTLPDRTQHALSAAVRAGPEAIRAASAGYYSKLSTDGWSMPVSNTGTYGTDYRLRAVVAMNFLAANLPEDAVYGFTFADEDGQPLAGSGRYRMHFERGALPPVNAFWSVTLYDIRGHLVENPIDRYAVSPHLGNVVFNPDGSLDIYIQNSPPEKPGTSNWLPAPAGPFNLMLRLYWPGAEVLSGQWKPPGVLKV